MIDATINLLAWIGFLTPVVYIVLNKLLRAWVRR